jgi:hypothetical protein
MQPDAVELDRRISRDAKRMGFWAFAAQALGTALFIDVAWAVAFDFPSGVSDASRTIALVLVITEIIAMFASFWQVMRFHRMILGWKAELRSLSSTF